MVFLKIEVVAGVVLEHDDERSHELHDLKVIRQLRSIPHLPVACFQGATVCRFGVNGDHKCSSSLFSDTPHCGRR